MATFIHMPEIAAGTDSATLVSWSVKEGDNIAQEDCLADIETDKATIELKAETSGVLGRILVQANTEAEVGTPLAVLIAEGEGEAAIESLLAEHGAAQDSELLAAVKHTESQPAQAPIPETDDQEAHSERVFASPVARRLAREAGLDLATLDGSGPDGRIVKRDVQAARPDTIAGSAAMLEGSDLAQNAEARPAVPTAPYRDEPHTSMRRTIARRLSESKQSVPHFYLRADCQMDALLDMRTQINNVAEYGVSVNDIIVKAVGTALGQFPAMNVSWTEAALRHYEDVDISVAVSTPSGLFTPVVRAVDTMPLSVVSRSLSDLAQRARDGTLAPHEYQGGSFTVSNLGMYGVREFSAIINPPQAAILAVGGIESRPVVSKGALAVAPVMTVVLSADHRAIDGAVAAQWLKLFKSIVENPLSALI